MKVLVVDDERDFLEQAKAFLEMKDRLDVETCNSSRKGFEIIKNDELDAIVSDYQMPEMDGLEILKAVREGLKENIPFIMLTGKGNEEIAMEALNLGADRYFRKEGKMNILFERLANAIKKEVENYRVRERKEFLHSVLMHDLLSKLQTIGFYHELAEEMDSGEKRERSIQKAEKARNEGVELLEKIRTLEEIGEEEIEEVKIAALMNGIIEQKETPASLEGMEIERGDLEVSVMGGRLLEELFSNLIENSIRHSGGDKIKISTYREDNWVIVRVEDNGRGIPSAEREKIFERGYKKESSGSGLGLYLIKEIAESYGGFVEVKDSELGGARFDVYLKKV